MAPLPRGGIPPVARTRLPRIHRHDYGWFHRPSGARPSAKRGYGCPAEGEVLVSFEDDGDIVLTVFVPVDERYRYRLEIGRPDSDVRFVDDDVESFDGIGTLAIFVPEGFLATGTWEVRVTELDSSGTSPIEVQQFQYPFRLE